MRRFGGTANLRRRVRRDLWRARLAWPDQRRRDPSTPQHAEARERRRGEPDQQQNQPPTQVHVSFAAHSYERPSKWLQPKMRCAGSGWSSLDPRARDRRQAHGRNAAPCQRTDWSASPGIEPLRRALPASAGAHVACGSAANAPARRSSPPSPPSAPERGRARRTRPSRDAIWAGESGTSNSTPQNPRRHHLVTAYAESPSTLSMRSSSGAGRSVPRSRAPVAERSTSAAACERVRVVNIAISGRCSRSARRLPPP